ncbi:MAG: hypothetical protein ACKOU7_02045, partial [Ferruginibacter sp.]
MKKLIGCMAFCSFVFTASAQKKGKLISGIYLQWGYNTEWYSRSSIHFKMPGGTDFTLHHVKAMDRPDLDAVYKKPKDISIPQY